MYSVYSRRFKPYLAHSDQACYTHSKALSSAPIGGRRPLLIKTIVATSAFIYRPLCVELFCYHRYGKQIWKHGVIAVKPVLICLKKKTENNTTSSSCYLKKTAECSGFLANTSDLWLPFQSSLSPCNRCLSIRKVAYLR